MSECKSWGAQEYERVAVHGESGRLVHLCKPNDAALRTVAAACNQAPSRFSALSFHLWDPETKSFPTEPKGGVSISERKRILLCDTPETAMEKMEAEAEIEMGKLDRENLSNEECWLHPSPKAYGTNVISKDLAWRSIEGEACRLKIQLGMVLLLLTHWVAPQEYPFTEEQKRGYIEEAWHLSHLCGNWTCLNYHHFTVEPDSVNIARNSCFKHDNGCAHNPPCLKHLKRPVDDLRPAIFTEDELDGPPPSAHYDGE